MVSRLRLSPCFVVLVLVALSSESVAQRLPACETGVQCPSSMICSGFRCLTLEELRGAHFDQLHYTIAVGVMPVRPLDARPATLDAVKWLTRTLLRNFGSAPEYRLVSSSRFPVGWQADSAFLSTFPKERWRLTNVHGVIGGSIRSLSPDRLEVSLFLVPIGLQTVKAAPSIKVYLTPKARYVNELANLFSNEVTRAFTGRRGAFGTKIAFSRQIRLGVKEIFVSRYLSTRPRQVTRDGSLALLPSWSRDGRLAFTSYRRGNPDLYVGRRTLSARARLNIGASFAPDGRRLALSLSKDGNAEIYLLDAHNGAILKRLTRNRSIDISPSFSPDGRYLAFVSDRSGSPQIYAMDLRTPDRPARVSKSGAYNTSPNWSPDGTMIVYCGQTAGATRFDLFVYYVRSGHTRRITSLGKNERPWFSPDSRWIVFSRKTKKATRLYVIRPDGTGLRELPLGPGLDTMPAWSF